MFIRKLTLLLAMVFSGTLVTAQDTTQVAASEMENNISQSRELVNFLEGTLNFLGDSTEVPSEKDIIINQSYLKIFQSDETQIEDDLDPDREMPMMKDVQAYLKDVVFFFKEVKFTFQINDVQPLIGQNGETVFKVTLNRNLKGITINNDTLDNNLTRYIEINLDPVQKEMKIASIYTTRPSQRQELKYWWVHMSANWKNFFADSLVVYDTLPFSKITNFTDSSLILNRWHPDLRTDTMLVFQGDTLYPEKVPDSARTSSTVVVDSTIHYVLVYDTIPVDVDTIYQILEKFKNMKKVDLSGNKTFTNITPLTELSDLTEVDLSNSLIDDLTPVRNLNKLGLINCSGSKVNSLEPLRYSSNLTELNCSNTPVSDISMLENLKNLTKLDFSRTQIADISSLSALPQLRQLNLSYTPVTDLSAISNMSSLTDLNISGLKITDLSATGKISSLHNLNIDSTSVTDLTPLSKLENLHILQANNSAIADITPLSGLSTLKYIYCDNSGIDEQKANAFMKNNTHCLVIYNTKKLEQWWRNLSLTYKLIIQDLLKIGDTITTEELHKIINLTEVNLSWQKDIKDIGPLSMLHRLEKVNLEGTNVTDLKPLADLNNLAELNIKTTPVNSLEPLNNLINLKTLQCEDTKINDLMPLANNTGLQTVYCDHSAVTQQNVLQFRKVLPSCLVIWQSDFLKSWWEGLSNTWQTEFEKQMKFEGDYGRENLQRLVNLHKITISDNQSVKNLNPLTVFMELKTLTVNNTKITDIEPITGLPELEELNLPNNPIAAMPGIVKLKSVKNLNVENTIIEDMDNIGQMTWLVSLNIAGTRIKKLKSIENLVNLQSLIINNTQIKNLKPLEKLISLKELKCFRTPIKSSTLENFKNEHPDIDVTHY